MLEIIISILGILVVILGYTTFNLLKKNENAEDIIISYVDFYNKMSNEIEKSEKRLKEIDKKGTFKSDDEIGWFFNEIVKLQNNISKFKTNL
jgi:predicted house-cleaning NTP pyrophosphatase (Maf/HAM1 superfamily)